MSTRPSNLTALEQGTGRSWDDWLAYFTSIGAKDLDHTEIARRIHADGLATEWWAQGATVAFEQHIGRRLPGQRADGSFSASASRTVPAGREEAFARAEEVVRGSADRLGLTGLRTSVTAVRSYVRASGPHGEKFSVAVEGAGESGEKSKAVVTLDALAAPEGAETWRGIGRDLLKEI